MLTEKLSRLPKQRNNDNKRFGAEFLLSIRKFFAKVYIFLKQERAIFGASLISVFSLGYFFLTAYSTFFLEEQIVSNLRTTGLVFFSGIFLVSLWASLESGKGIFDKLSTWLQSSILTFFSLTYFLSIENRSFYPFAISILVSIIFLINFDLFWQRRYFLYSTVAQILLFTLQTFSLIYFFSVDRIAARNFNQNILGQVLSLNSLFWILICTFGVTLISVSSFKLVKVSQRLLLGSILFLLFFQIMMVVNYLDFVFFPYWLKTLSFLIFWDFVYSPVKLISTNSIDDKYWPRLIVSTAYHFVLILIVFSFAIFI